MKNYKLSKFTIIVGLESTSEKSMLVHGYTGAIDIVSNNVIQYLANIENINENDFSLISQNTFEVLIRRGYVTTKSDEEEYKYVLSLSNIMDKTRTLYPKQFMFMVAYNCNFRCPYCYEGKLTPNCRQWSGKVLSKEMVDMAYDSMTVIEKKQELHNKQIILYGGEPLLKENKSIIEYIVRKGKELGYYFAAITNGYDLNFFEDLLEYDLIRMLQITVDGCEEHHNKRRIHYQNKDSFKVIIHNIGIALQKGVTVAIRVNTDHNNIGDLLRLEKLFDKLGYSKYANFSINSALLVDYSPSNSKNNHSVQNFSKELNYMNRLEYLNQLNKIGFRECQDFGIYNRLYSSIKHNTHLSFRTFFCGAQTGMYIFDPFGDIYSCWNDVGNVDNAIGNYLNGIQWTKAKEIWLNTGVLTYEECCHCKYIFLCRGGCVSHSILKNKGIKPYCDDFNDSFIYAANRAYNEYIMSI